jgi:hypothetical protein
VLRTGFPVRIPQTASARSSRVRVRRECPLRNTFYSAAFVRRWRWWPKSQSTEARLEAAQPRARQTGPRQVSLGTCGRDTRASRCCRHADVCKIVNLSFDDGDRRRSQQQRQRQRETDEMAHTSTRSATASACGEAAVKRRRRHVERWHCITVCARRTHLCLTEFSRMTRWMRFQVSVCQSSRERDTRLHAAH